MSNFKLHCTFFAMKLINPLFRQTGPSSKVSQMVTSTVARIFKKGQLLEYDHGPVCCMDTCTRPQCPRIAASMHIGLIHQCPSLLSTESYKPPNFPVLPAGSEKSMSTNVEPHISPFMVAVCTPMTSMEITGFWGKLPLLGSYWWLDGLPHGSLMPRPLPLQHTEAPWVPLLRNRLVFGRGALVFNKREPVFLSDF